MDFQRLISAVLALTLSTVGVFPNAVSAGMVGTAAILDLDIDRSSPRERVQTALTREDVRERLEAYGVAPEDAKQRVAVLSDAELRELSQRMETLPAGGDILGMAVFVFLVLLVTDILGYTDIFPFVTSTPGEK